MINQTRLLLHPELGDLGLKLCPQHFDEDYDHDVLAVRSGVFVRARSGFVLGMSFVHSVVGRCQASPIAGLESGSASSGGRGSLAVGAGPLRIRQGRVREGGAGNNRNVNLTPGIQ